MERLAWLISTTALLGGCSLGNIGFDECESNDACIVAFGLGSQCSAGFCTAASNCETGFDCHKTFGGGACVEGTCRDTLPTHPQCPPELLEPIDLAARRLTSDPPTLVIGSILSTDEESDIARNMSARLAVREINDVGGLNNDTQLAIVTCDNGGTDNATIDQERQQLNRNALDFLSGSLGVSGIVGPVRSSDSITTINHLIAKQFPTVLISPSATSPQLTAQPDRLEPPNDTYGLFWRTCPSDELQGSVLANDVVGVHPEAATIDTVAVLYLDDAYGLGLATVFEEAFEEQMGKSAVLLAFDEKTDWASKAAAVEALDPDGVLMIAIKAERTIAFIEQMAKTEFSDKPLYLTDGSKDESKLLDDTLSDEIKAIIRNQTVGTAPGSPTSGGPYGAFEAALKSQFGISASDYSFVAQAYDAGYALGYALVYATQDASFVNGVGVASGLARLGKGATTTIDVGKNSWIPAKAALTTGEKRIDIEGVSGPLNFDAELGEGPAPIEVWRPSMDLDAFEIVDSSTPM